MRLTARISNISLTKTLSDKVDIYFRNLNKMYYHGVTDMDKFARDYGIADMNDLLARHYQHEFMPVGDNAQESELLWFNTVTVHGVNTKVPLVQSIVRIDKDALKNVIKDASAYPDSHILLLDRQGKLLCYHGMF